MEARLPKYKQIYDAIRNDIILQNVKEGSFLPTETQLMEAYGAGRSTIRHALSLLQEEGYIAVRQGSGSVVLGQKISRSMDRVNTHFKGFELEYHVPKPHSITISSAAVEKVPAPPEVAEALRIPAGQCVYRFQRMWSVGGRQYNHMIQYVHRGLLPGIRKLMDIQGQHLYGAMEEHYGLRYLDGEEHITAIAADFVEANLLDVKIGDPLLLTTRIANCEKGPFEYALFYQNPKLMGYKLMV